MDGVRLALRLDPVQRFLDRFIVDRSVLLAHAKAHDARARRRLQEGHRRDLGPVPAGARIRAGEGLGMHDVRRQVDARVNHGDASGQGEGRDHADLRLPFKRRATHSSASRRRASISSA